MFSRSTSVRAARYCLLVAIVLAVAACGDGASDGAVGPAAPAASDETSTADEAAADTPTETSDPSTADAPEPEPTESAGAGDIAAVLPADAMERVNGGSVLIDGSEYRFEIERCNLDGDALVHDGFGVAADGTPFTARIADASGVTTVDVTLGQSALGALITPDLAAYSMDSFGDPALRVERDGQRISGSGVGSDKNLSLAQRVDVEIAFVSHCTPS